MKTKLDTLDALPFLKAFPVLFTSLFLIVSSPAIAGDRCPSASLETLKTQFAGKGETEIIFFATWCSECASHIKAPHGPDTILVSTFDEKGRAEKVLKSLGVRTPCYTDDGLSEALGVREVPAKRRVKF